MKNLRPGPRGAFRVCPPQQFMRGWDFRPGGVNMATATYTATQTAGSVRYQAGDGLRYPRSANSFDAFTNSSRI